MKNVVHNADCLPAMRKMKDNEFSLALVDPPYGIGMDGGRIGKSKKYKRKDWDKAAPIKKYFIELQRVSNNQIIWGGNYFNLPISKGWIYWDKMQDGFGKTFSSGELAWTSFNNPMRQIRYKWQGNYYGFEDNISTKSCNGLENIHPTQKPIALYKWLLKNYAKEGDTIFDSHVGSGSSRIACYEMGFSFVGYEIDVDYWEAQEKRFNIVKNQMKLF